MAGQKEILEEGDQASVGSGDSPSPGKKHVLYNPDADETGASVRLTGLTTLCPSSQVSTPHPPRRSALC